MSTSRKSTLSFVTLAAPKENAQGAKLLQLRLGRLGIDYLDVSLRLRMRYTDGLTAFTTTTASAYSLYRRIQIYARFGQRTNPLRFLSRID
jgi:hypothetical protein